jgi:hypothetical protein
MTIRVLSALIVMIIMICHDKTNQIIFYHNKS